MPRAKKKVERGTVYVHVPETDRTDPRNGRYDKVKGKWIRRIESPVETHNFVSLEFLLGRVKTWLKEYGPEATFEMHVKDDYDGSQLIEINIAYYREASIEEEAALKDQLERDAVWQKNRKTLAELKEDRDVLKFLEDHPELDIVPKGKV